MVDTNGSAGVGKQGGRDAEGPMAMVYHDRQVLINQINSMHVPACYSLTMN